MQLRQILIAFSRTDIYSPKLIPSINRKENIRNKIKGKKTLNFISLIIMNIYIFAN